MKLKSEFIKTKDKSYKQTYKISVAELFDEEGHLLQEKTEKYVQSLLDRVTKK